MDMAQLWKNAGDGCDDSVADLLDAYRPYLLAIANATLHRDVRSKLAASDIVQETIVSAHTKFPDFVGNSEAALRSWLRQILKNQMVDYSRAFRGTSKRDVRREVSLDQPLLKTVCCTDNPVSNCLQVELRVRLRRELDLLPETERQVVELYHENGLSFTEIAINQNCSRETVRRCWIRALTILAARIGDDSCLNQKMN